MSDNINVPKKEWEAMKSQLSLITKATSKRKLARHTPQDSIGKSVKISLYVDPETGDKSLVTGWKLKKDFVRTTKEQGVVEDQIMEVFYENDLTAAQKNGHNVQISKLQKELDNTKEFKEGRKEYLETKIAEHQRKIEQSNKGSVDMPYSDFIKLHIEKVSVDVLGHTKTSEGEFFTIEYDDKSYDIDVRFIN